MATSILNEKKLLLAEWRDERSRKGGDADAYTAAEADLDLVSSKVHGSGKFNEAALAETRQKVGQWRQQKAAQREQEEVRTVH
jgi:hypothetical protein